MKSAYNDLWIYNLEVIKATKLWFKKGFISKDQLEKIHSEYSVPFYHPNFVIRLLLFFATILALSGITGLLTLMILDTNESVIWTGCLVYGIASFFILEGVFIRNNHHFKSGVTEALLYHSCGFTIGGVVGMTDGDNIHLILVMCLLVFAFAAIRYVDLLSTTAAFISMCAIIFYECFNAGEILKQLIPFVFIIFFSSVYFYVRMIAKEQRLRVWHYNLLILQFLSLLIIYAAGNYLVVRELSIEFMGLAMDEGEDIPYAFVFYALTVLIPLMYLYFGIRKKDIVLIRVSLIVIAFSVFTFKYYYSLGHQEITLTIAGLILLAISLSLLNYLKTMRDGYTRENLLEEKWGNVNVQAMIIAQTMGGNKGMVHEEFKGEGGEFGGGGATGNY